MSVAVAIITRHISRSKKSVLKPKPVSLAQITDVLREGLYLQMSVLDIQPKSGLQQALVKFITGVH